MRRAIFISFLILQTLILSSYPNSIDALTKLDKFIKCCSAKTSVGANKIPCFFSIAVHNRAINAIIVLPEPTSPCSNLAIGNFEDRSLSISEIEST